MQARNIKKLLEEAALARRERREAKKQSPAAVDEQPQAIAPGQLQPAATEQKEEFKLPPQEAPASVAAAALLQTPNPIPQYSEALIPGTVSINEGIAQQEALLRQYEQKSQPIGPLDSKIEPVNELKKLHSSYDQKIFNTVSSTTGLPNVLSQIVAEYHLSDFSEVYVQKIFNAVSSTTGLPNVLSQIVAQYAALIDFSQLSEEEQNRLIETLNFEECDMRRMFTNNKENKTFYQKFHERINQLRQKIIVVNFRKTNFENCVGLGNLLSIPNMQYRYPCPSVLIDFTGANLSKIKWRKQIDPRSSILPLIGLFDDVTLQEAEFDNVNFRTAVFANADLEGADFYCFNSGQTEFENLSLNQVSFRECMLHKIIMKNADIRGINFTGSYACIEEQEYPLQDIRVQGMGLSYNYCFNKLELKWPLGTSLRLGNGLLQEKLPPLALLEPLSWDPDEKKPNLYGKGSHELNLLGTYCQLNDVTIVLKHYYIHTYCQRPDKQDGFFSRVPAHKQLVEHCFDEKISLEEANNIVKQIKKCIGHPKPSSEFYCCLEALIRCFVEEKQIKGDIATLLKSSAFVDDFIRYLASSLPGLKQLFKKEPAPEVLPLPAHR